VVGVAAAEAFRPHSPKGYCPEDIQLARRAHGRSTMMQGQSGDVAGRGAGAYQSHGVRCSSKTSAPATISTRATPTAYAARAVAALTKSAKPPKVPPAR